jgi:amino acid transporter
VRVHRPAAGTTSASQLPRALGLRHAIAIVVGTIIGSGIFLVPKEMMQAVGSAKLVYLAWIVGGILSIFGALTYAELGALKPQAGGEYVYVRDGYGPLAGFPQQQRDLVSFSNYVGATGSFARDCRNLGFELRRSP